MTTMVREHRVNFIVRDQDHVISAHEDGLVAMWTLPEYNSSIFYIILFALTVVVLYEYSRNSVKPIGICCQLLFFVFCFFVFLFFFAKKKHIDKLASVKCKGAVRQLQ